ncbi:hypothetical protein HYR54_01405 [Candidatus Acetothermia bacterium]|nr:hypothetical protein [Candidatus Acetothermia bacterium]MBI3461158.1 hypothetical protein [Candidatus Acetothermia bacterium]
MVVLYEILLVVLSLLSVGLLVYEVSADLLQDQVAFIHTLDFAIALVFLADFVIGFIRAKSKWEYFNRTFAFQHK